MTIRQIAIAALAMLALSVAAPVWAAADSDESRIADLVIASRILADQGVLDGFGHVSVRSVKNPKHFYMPRSLAPALVTRADIMEFDENSEPVDAQGRAIASERYIHGEAYRARPDVQAVVHAHTPSVLPFSVTKTPMKPLTHTAYFLGAEPVPVFDIRDAEGADNKMLVTSGKTAAALAKVLGARAVALLRGHGMIVVADSLPWVTFRAIYTKANAEIELEALKLGPVNFLNNFEVNRADRVERHWDVWTLAAKAHALDGWTGK